MFEFTALGSVILTLALWNAIAFWGLVLTIFVLICFDQGAISLGVLLAAAVASNFVGLWSFDLLMQHHAAVLWFLVFYVPAGLVWATLKWWLYCFKLARKVGEYLTAQEAELVKDANTPDQVAVQMGRIRDSLWNSFEKLPPVVRGHKSDLIRWMSWWPFSILASVFSDLIREVFDAIYDRVAKIWQSIADHAFRNVNYQNPPAE